MKDIIKLIQVNKKKSKLVFRISLSCIVAFTISIFLLSFFYLNKANYYGDIIVIPTNRSMAYNVEVLGVSPFERLLESDSDSVLYKYQYSRYYNRLVFKNNTKHIIELTIMLNSGDFVEKIFIEPNNDFSYEFTNIRKGGFLKDTKRFVGFVLMKKATSIFLIILLVVFLFTALFKYRILVYRKIKFVLRFSKISNKTLYLKSLLFTILSLLLGSIYLNFTGVFKQNPLDNQVNIRLIPDQLDYHTIAVNFAIKDVFRINGIIDSTVNYRINIENPKSQIKQLEDKNNLDYNSGINCFHRFPGYPLFVGLVYKVVGINPIVIKLIQLLILIITLFFIPVFTYSIWGVNGFWAGVLSQIIFYVNVYPSIALISQDLITICINVYILWLFYKFRQTKALKTAIVLGIALGVSFLIKSSLMFFVFFMFAYFTIIIIRNKDILLLKNSSLAGLIFVLIWLPFNIIALVNFNVARENSIKFISDINEGYHADSINHNLQNYYYGETIKSLLYPITADDINVYRTNLYEEVFAYKTFNQLLAQNYSRKSIRMAYIQMHSEHPKLFFLIALYPTNTGLDLHNEYVLDGRQHVEWRYNTDSYYNNDGNVENIFPKSAIEFYKNNPKMLFTIAYSKFETIFNGVLIFKIFAIVLSIFVLVHIIVYRKLKAGLVLFAAAIINILIFFLVSTTLAVLLSFIMLLLMVLFYKKLKLIYIPVEFIWLILSMLLFIFITFAVERYVFYYYLPVVLITVFCLGEIFRTSYKCL